MFADQDQPGRPAPLWAIAWFVSLILCTVVVRLADPTGWLGSDDAAYHSAAEHVLTGTPIQRLHHHYARMAVILPIAASMAAFGNNAQAVALPATVASVVCVVLVVLLGRRLWGWWEGLFAGTVVAVLPYFRVLSTTAYPDVHVCLWTTAAILLAFMAVRTESRRHAVVLWSLAGVTFTLAVSAKVFAVAALAGIACVPIVMRCGVNFGPLPHGRGTERFVPSCLRAFVPFFLGALTLLLIDGLFYSWIAGDFFFSLRATLSASDNVPSIAAESPTQAGFLALVWDRLAFFYRQSTSGWGVIAIPFWWILLCAALFDRPARALVAWAFATFALVAFVPVSFKNGAQAYPIFHGRHILPACVPFALCLAWIICRAGEATLGPAGRRRALPIAMTVIVAIAYVETRSLNGFRDRETSRVGAAAGQMIPSIPDDGRRIFMTPSMYWRFRVLFPPELRSRLRVAAAEGAPAWWKDACVDIAARREVLPSPHDAYLIATPRQLRGDAEQWDYGVSLPPADLTPWQAVRPISTFVRGADKRIRPASGLNDPLETVLVLAGEGGKAPQSAVSQPQARLHTDR